MKIRFEWDPAKAASNLQKHGVSFEIARQVFVDPFARMAPDRVEGGEQRWRAVGMVAGAVLLVVAHTLREADGIEVIRIISARRAEPKERRRYEQETGDDRV